MKRNQKEVELLEDYAGHPAGPIVVHSSLASSLVSRGIAKYPGTEPEVKAKPQPKKEATPKDVAKPQPKKK